MSSTKRIANVGGSVRASDFNGAAGAAAAADDRALEILCTPGSVQKKILPLSEETAAINPRLLVVGKDVDGTMANGVVRLRPAHFLAGLSGDSYTVNLGAKQKVNLDSAVFGSNSSGSTRFDLLYATISYGTLTQETVRQKPLSGGAPVSTLLTTQADMLITLSIVAGVASGNPLASLPADAVDGTSYNFGLAMVSLANGFSGGAVNQSTITPLWSGGWVQPQRVRGVRPMSVFTGAASEKIANHMSERFGSDVRYMGLFKLLTTTGASPALGFTLDNTIDWTNRLIWGWVAYLGTANTAIESRVASLQPVTKDFFFGFSGDASGSTTFGILTYNSSATQVGFGTTSGGPAKELRAYRALGNPIDTVNGDLIAVALHASDQLLTTM